MFTSLFKNLTLIIMSLVIVSCGGGGGGGGGDPITPPTPFPTVNLSADPASVEIDNTTTLTWSSTNATSCSATWTSQTGNFGSEEITISTAGNNTFSIACSGAGGSQSATVEVEGYRSMNGISVDGYISGAEICIDENENWLCESGENSTTSDNDGKFNIKYANGNLLSIGGTDLDTQILLDKLLINHKLTGHSNFKVISPITSVASFLSDSSIIYTALGIDNSIDIYTFDPVSNISQSGINDYVYEKGNQLTILAFTLQNLTNSINSSAETTQDFFKSISEELEQEFSQTNELVDIKSSVFIQKVLENVILEKSLSVGDTSKVNTVSAISNVLPILKVYSDSQITKAVFNFSISTLQNEIPSITNGTADGALINSYTNDIYNYIANDQNIDVNKIKPNSLPVITTDLSSLTIDENEFNVTNIEAVDDDGDEIFYSLSGIDADLLNITNTGALSFNLSPDFEVPSDSDGDNNYVFNVAVTDDSSASQSGYDFSASTEDNTNVAVQNIDEDLIYFNLLSVDGTDTSSPKLNISMQIDSLTKAEEIQVLIEYPTASNPDSTDFGDGAQEFLYTGIGTNDGINWNISHDLPVYSLSGTYKVRDLRITRGNLDDLTINASTIQSKGFESSISLQNSRQDIVNPVLQSISDFSITGNDGDDATNITVSFNATVVEENLKEVRVFIKFPGGADKDFTGVINADGKVSFAIELNPNASSGDYLIDRFIIEDIAGNRITYTNQQLSNAGINNKWILDNDIADDQAPKILSLTLNPVYDNSDFDRKNIQVKVLTDAQQTPIERIYIRLTNEDGVTQIDEDFPTEQFVLTAAEYVHTFALPFEYPSGTYNVDYIFIKDRAENINNYSTSDIKTNSWDDKVVFEGKNRFIGKVIDGYISGAEVFIDQNFNFNKDPGELSTVSQDNGSFLIGTDDDSLYQCLQNRPIVAAVPVGATDGSLGEVETAFRMILPSINDAGGNNSIVITPFTDLLSQSIINAKENSSITEDLTVTEGCQSVGDSIASSVTNEINQIVETIQSSFGVSLADLVSDYISGNSSSIINETKAQRIGSFLPYFKLIQDQIDADLTAKYNKNIYTNLTLEDESINTILSDDNFELLPLDFFTVYKTEPNSAGWFTEESIRAKGAKLSINGEVKHYKCITEPENCTTTDYTTSKLGDASEDYKNMTYFLNPGYSSTDDISFFIEDNRRWSTQTRDGELVREKDCVFGEQLQISPKDRGNLDVLTSMSTDANNYDIQVDSCDGLADTTKNLFTQKTTTYETTSDLENSNMQYINSNWDKAQYLQNKIINAYTNRENLDLDAVVLELKGLPYKYKDLNKARAYANDAAGDRVYLQYTLRNVSNSNTVENHSISIRENPDDDEYSKLELNSDGALIETAKSTGQQARDDLFNAFKNSAGYGGENFIGTDSVKDNRVSIQGRTLDGYISGAKVFVDVNFNFKHDAGEYSTFTGANGVFDLKYDQSDAVCVEARPLVADVPVGANDETQGEVTQAYKMIMPSIDDSDGAPITISPYSSLIGDAIILGKQNSGIVDELTVTEGCGSLGDSIASQVSTSLNALKSTIENTYGVSLNELLADFIANPSDDVNETTAANIAKLFPWLRLIDEDISNFLTNRYEKDITANIILSDASLDKIFSNTSFEELPLEFSAIYETKPNDSGWYQQERIISSGGLITDSGILKRVDCSQTDTELCSGSDVGLERVANTATNYNRESSFINQNISLDSSIDMGSIYVTGKDARSWRNDSVNWNEPNNRARECQTDNSIRFRNNEGDEFSYNTYSQGYGKSDCNEVKHYYTPQLEIQQFDSASNESIEFSYYIFDILRTGVISNTPYDFIKNYLSVDPTITINEIAQLPKVFSKVDEIRRMFNVDDYVLIDFYKTSDCTYQFEFGSNPRNDYYRERGCTTQNEYYSQDARDAMHNLLSSESVWNSTASDNAPKSKVLGRLSTPFIEVVDYLNLDGSEVKYDVYPIHTKGSKVLDLSLKGASVDLNNLKDFLSNGIGNTPLNANIYFNPDDSITGTVPITLSLYQVNEGTEPNATAESGEDYMQIDFNLDVQPTTDGLMFTLPANAEITAVYNSGSVAITKKVINTEADSIIINDGLINQPSSLNLKLLNLLGTISDEIENIEDFFTDNGTYFYQVYLNSYSIIDYHRNTVDYIQGSFTTKNNTSDRAVFVRDMYIKEGETKNLCFFRSAGGNLPALDINISFQERERPGRGGDINDFILSSNKVSFAENDLEKCITFEAATDYWFDWLHVIYLDLSTENPQHLSRDQVEIMIQDPLGFNRISGSNLK
tara:strand:- start:2191 stop:9084 length:6894 start_codon:yes stop_codon:yes gene_type:complete